MVSLLFLVGAVINEGDSPLVVGGGGGFHQDQVPRVALVGDDAFASVGKRGWVIRPWSCVILYTEIL